MKDDSVFQGRHIRIVTQHQKEKVIAPILQKKLGVTCSVIRTINTDSFGTFSGEIPRTGSPLDAARAKCNAGASLYPDSLILASEGSFAPHPYLPFVYGNEELLLLTDPLNGKEWKVSDLTLRTNFDARTIHSENELQEFARHCGFPSHAIILRSSNQPDELVKGIHSFTRLKYYYRKIGGRHKPLRAETDMRAMCNPTRMEFIRKVARKLVRLLLRKCPACHTPGYDLTEVIRGLPCTWCGEPTPSALYHIYSCKACGHSSEKPFPHGKRKEDPSYCNSCNP